MVLRDVLKVGQCGILKAKQNKTAFETIWPARTAYSCNNTKNDWPKCKELNQQINVCLPYGNNLQEFLHWFSDLFKAVKVGID